MGARRSQKVSGNLFSFCKEFSWIVQFKFKKENVRKRVSSSLFIKVHDTELLLKARPSSRVHVIGDKTVSVRCNVNNNRKIKICVSLVCDKTKLFLFSVLKSQPNGRLKRTYVTIFKVVVLAAVILKAEWVI